MNKETIKERIGRIMSSAPISTQENLATIMEFFAIAEDEDFMEVFQRFPVSEIFAISENLLQDKYFDEFIEKMIVIIPIEQAIQKAAAKVIKAIEEKDLKNFRSGMIELAKSKIELEDACG